MFSSTQAAAAGTCSSASVMLRLARRVDGAAGAGEAEGEAGERGELGGEGLGGGDADFRAGDGEQHGVAFAGHGAFRHVEDGEDGHGRPAMYFSAASVSAVSPDWLTSRPRPSGDSRRAAVAEFAGDVDIGGQAGEFLDPVAAGQAGVIGADRRR